MGGRKKPEDRLKALQKSPQNKYCIACVNRKGLQQYVVPNLCIFVCQDCAGVFNQFGLRTKGVTMSKFSEEEVDKIEQGGNDRAREVYLARFKGSYSQYSTKAFVEMAFIKQDWKGGSSGGDVNQSPLRTGNGRQPPARPARNSFSSSNGNANPGNGFDDNFGGPTSNGGNDFGSDFDAAFNSGGFGGGGGGGDVSSGFGPDDGFGSSSSAPLSRPVASGFDDAFGNDSAFGGSAAPPNPPASAAGGSNVFNSLFDDVPAQDTSPAPATADFLSDMTSNVPSSGMPQASSMGQATAMMGAMNMGGMPPMGLPQQSMGMGMPQQSMGFMPQQNMGFGAPQVMAQAPVSSMDAMAPSQSAAADLFATSMEPDTPAPAAPVLSGQAEKRDTKKEISADLFADVGPGFSPKPAEEKKLANPFGGSDSSPASEQTASAPATIPGLAPNTVGMAPANSMGMAPIGMPMASSMMNPGMAVPMGGMRGMSPDMGMGGVPQMGMAPQMGMPPMDVPSAPAAPSPAVPGTPAIPSITPQQQQMMAQMMQNPAAMQQMMMMMSGQPQNPGGALMQQPPATPAPAPSPAPSASAPAPAAFNPFAAAGATTPAPAPAEAAGSLAFNPFA